MQKIDSLNQVSEFHKTFNAPVLSEPQIPNADRCQLRISLLQEELDELKESIQQSDIVGIADALCDLQYVLSGAVLEFGLGEKFTQLFNEVQRSNMSKACSSETQAQSTLEYYQQKDGTIGHYKQVGDKWVCYRTSDNKVLKSINYSPADIKSILDKII